MNTEKYHGKYYKGEPIAPPKFTQMEVFLGIRKEFLHDKSYRYQKEFDDWLEHLITEYLPEKNLIGFETRDYKEKATAEYRFAYEFGVKL